MIKKRNRFFLIFVFIFMLFLLWLAKIYPSRQAYYQIEGDPDYFGVTFSTKFCKEIGLDWKEVYLNILDDLQVKNIRLPIYWDEIEKEPGVFDFTDYDFIISEGEKRGVKFIINIGWRLPRWPECHAPDWASKEGLVSTQNYTLTMLETVIKRYQDSPAIVTWQLENEPFFDAFGVCPPSDEEFFSREIKLVKSLDDRPVLVSATGELSWWRKEAKYADIFGSTLYRIVWGPLTGYTRYPLPAWFYRLKAWLAGIPPEKRVIIELQAEPWVPKGSMVYLPEEEADKSFNLNQFKLNIKYAYKLQFKQAYLWGVEWWYLQYKNNDPEYWRFARQLFR